ncbi:hypothetical protein ACFS4T_17950 [Pseudomonas lini]
MSVLLLDRAMVGGVIQEVDDRVSGHHPGHDCLEHAMRGSWINYRGRIADHEVTGPGAMATGSPGDIHTSYFREVMQVLER